MCVLKKKKKNQISQCVPQIFIKYLFCDIGFGHFHRLRYSKDLYLKKKNSTQDKNPGSSHFKKGLQLSKGAFFESV